MAHGRDAGRGPPGRRGAAGCAARATPPGTDRARWRLGRILAARAVHVVGDFGLLVVRLEVLVGDRPCRRAAIAVAKLAEVLGAKPVQRGAVELRRAADAVVHLRLERLVVLVVPRV